MSNLGGTYGGFAPRPKRYGGGPQTVQFIYAALNSGRGKAYSTSAWNSTVAVENRAIARAITGGWEVNARAVNQFDPNRTTDMLPRWERIFSTFLLTQPGDSDNVRRGRLAFQWAGLGKDNVPQQIADDLAFVMGDAFVAAVNTLSADSKCIYPGGPNPNPYDLTGTTTAGVSYVDWSSAIAHVAIQVQQPAGMSNSYYQEAVSEGLSYLDGALPAWASMSVFQTTGFFLDQTNLGFAAFDS